MTKKTRNILVLLSALATLAIGGVATLGVMVMRSGITAGPDKMFGEQHLKTAVALIELHKIRSGEYPEAMKDIQFTGKWDAIALHRVSYKTNAKRTAYYVQVERGWMGKPELEMPSEFWTGTGYDPTLKEK